MHFLYPADVLKSKQPDEMYAGEAAAIRAAGFAVSVVPLESLLTGHAKIIPAELSGQQVVYRGWMLSSEEYEALCHVVSAHGGVPLTSPNQYLLAHHLPNWYPHLQEFTPETVVLGLEENLEARLSELGWERYFVKDYVKSLKTSVGSMIERPEQIATVVSVDVVQRTDGAERIVEIGDGQVSDIVGWRPERFAEIWHEYANRRSTATR